MLKMYIIKINREKFFEVLAGYPELEDAYTNDFWQKREKQIDPKRRLKISLKKDDFLPGKVDIYIGKSKWVTVIFFKVAFLKN